ncbi:MAG: DNA repair protein RadA [Propionibacteriaceae bacterium]|nr:DNA repair protein RadA [Propionibacteriaceae bacterium]
MAKNTNAKRGQSWRCSECGWESARWVGRCGECQAWGTVEEAGGPPGGAGRVAAVVPLSPAIPLSSVDPATARRRPSGIGEFDRVLGGGLVPGAVVLVAGEPGIGKSTLLLEVAARAGGPEGERPALYVSGEESAGQVRSRAERIGLGSAFLHLASETDVATVAGHVEALDPSLVVVDSVQTMRLAGVEGAAGGVAQVREATAALIAVAKARGLPLILVGHVTKDGSVAGPRTLEHLVDVVVTFEGDPHSGFRLLRATKNRFGATDEVGCFEMTESGMAEVPDPSGLFTHEFAEPIPGTARTVALEGRRPLLSEVQALIAPAPGQTAPRRVCHGVDPGRFAMILAVLQCRAGIRLHLMDAYAATVGGARVHEPAADLALALAVASAVLDRPLPSGLVALGEIGLAGEIRRVNGVERRVAEAARLGATTAIVPAGFDERSAGKGITIVEAHTVAQALDHLRLGRRHLAAVG